MPLTDGIKKVDKAITKLEDHAGDKIAGLEAKVEKFLGIDLFGQKGTHLKLGGIDLIKREDRYDGKIKEIRSVHNVSVLGKKRIVELQIPGSSGNVFQDMGRIPLRILFEGELIGPETKKTLKDLKSKFDLNQALPFSSNLTVLGDITEVVIESFSISFIDGVPQGSRYSIVLREYKSANAGGKKPSTETKPPSQEEDGKLDFEKRVSSVKRDASKVGI
jgi:hypothetical protein